MFAKNDLRNPICETRWTSYLSALDILKSNDKLEKRYEDDYFIIKELTETILSVEGNHVSAVMFYERYKIML
jgi:hypothetical protein